MENIAIKRRKFGEQVEHMSIPAAEFDSYKSQGWVDNADPLPEPEPPDIEVLELAQKDARAAMEAKAAELRHCENLLRQAGERLNHAKGLIGREDSVKQAIQDTDDRENAIQKAAALLQKATAPVPASGLLALAANEVQERAIRETFVNDGFVIGKGELGDWMLVGNKTQYLADEAAKQAREAEEKEAAVRQRMAAQNGGK